MRDRPWFLWDVPVTEAQLRERLKHSDPDTRAQWQACIMREARYPDIRMHLGRRRAFWEYLFEGWRRDGFLPAA